MPALNQAATKYSATWPPLPLGPRLRAPKSAGERWACAVFRACDADFDFRTLQDWASFVGMSYSALTQSCRLAGIQPRDARDFVRILRLLFHTQGRLESLEASLDISDVRTLRTLLQRAGIFGRTSREALSLPEFFSHQRFVDPNRTPRLIIAMLPASDPAPVASMG